MIAPGEYSPEKTVTALDGSPSYTFGLKVNHQKPSDTPGTNLSFLVFKKIVLHFWRPQYYSDTLFILSYLVILLI